MVEPKDEEEEQLHSGGAENMTGVAVDTMFHVD